MNRLLDYLIIQLMNRSDSYEHTGERFIFLADKLTDEDNIQLMIRLYSEDMDD